MSRVIVAAVDDLLFASKIRATAEPLGISVSFARNRPALKKLTDELHPDLIIINLEASSFDPLQVAKDLQENELTSPPDLLGFFSHVNTEVQQQAKHAGYTHVLPRSVFAARLSDILTGAL